MARYVTKPKGWYDDDEPFRPSLSVDSHEPVRTGLLNAKGEPLFRVPPPIGFGRHGEW